MKHYLYTLLILVLFSCSKDEPEKANTPPQAFEVTTKAEGTALTLTWTEAVDADGDAVAYAVVYGDTLAKGLTAKTYTIKNLPYETEIAGTVVASDGKGGKTESGFKVKTPESIYVNIPDVEFEKFLISEKIDDVLDGRLLRVSALGVTRMQMRYLYDIESLNGLEAFKDLEHLEIRTKKVKEISLKRLAKLKMFFVQDYGLVRVDLSDCPLVESIHVISLSISELDMGKNLKLKRLTCLGKELRTLHLENNSELSYLNVEGAANFNIDLSKNINLEEIDFWRTNVAKCDLSKNIKLKTIKIVKDDNYNEVADLVLPESASLTSLNASMNLRNLDLSKNTKLEYIDLSYNKLTELNLCNNPEIKNLNCRYNNITTVYINPSLRTSNWQKDPTATYKVCN